jgi:hypothetical protein
MIRTITHIAVLLTALCANQATGQHKILVEGTVSMSRHDQEIDCSFTISNLPPGSEYDVLIDSAFTVRYFRNPKTGYDYCINTCSNNSANGSNLAYYIPALGAGTKFLPKTLCINYFTQIKPLAHQNLSPIESSQIPATFPVLYDAYNRCVKSDVNYQVKFICADCDDDADDSQVFTTRGRE